MPDPDGGGRLDATLDTAPCGYLVVDDAGTVVLANVTLAGLLGRARSEIEGRHVDALLPPAGRIFYSTHLFPLLRLHGRAEELYMPMRHADGSEVPVLVNGVTRGDADAPAHHLVIVPMRQRNKLESELIEARRAAQAAAAAKDRFLSVVSHELRSPLAAITGFADLLLTERQGPLTEAQRRHVERIREAGRYQVRLIEDILDFAALTGDRRALDAVVLPVEEVLSRVEALLAMRAEDEGRTIERHPRPAAGRLRADGAAVQQILLNLGTNAIKYGAEGTTVRIEAAADDRTVRLSITDSGAGIPPDQLERIFEPFVRLDAGAAGGRGVGLGLAISRDLARAMGGDIEVVSEVGRGSTFSLTLPAG